MGSKGGGTTKTVAEPWKAAQPFLKNLLGDTRSAYGQGQFDIAPYTGPRVADQSPLTQASMQGYYNTGMAGNPITPQAQQGFSDLVAGDPYANLDALKQNVLGDVIPAVSARFANSGMGDSSVAADTISRAATSALAPIEYGAWENAQNRKLSALGMAPSLGAMSYLDPQMMGIAGQQQDMYNQRLADAAMQQYYEGANRPYDEIQRAASLAMGFGGMGGTQNSKQGGGDSTMSTIGGIVQTLGPIIGMAMMSDRRLKTDIKKIGKTDDGQKLYAYHYKGEPKDTPLHIGLMAQEVEKRNPDAVVEVGGYKAVNYHKALGF